MTVNLKMLNDLQWWLNDQWRLELEGTPSHWDQNVWIRFTGSCGTSCCAAGWVAMTEGGLPVRPDLYGRITEVVFPDGTVENIEVFSTVILDISVEERDTLFNPYNDIFRMNEIIENIRNEAYNNAY